MYEYELSNWWNEKNGSKNVESFRNFWFNFITQKQLWMVRYSHPWYDIVFSEDDVDNNDSVKNISLSTF